MSEPTQTCGLSTHGGSGAAMSFHSVTLDGVGAWIPCVGSDMEPVMLLSEGWCPSCTAYRHQLYEHEGRPGYCFTGDRWFRLQGQSIGWVANDVVRSSGWPWDWREDFPAGLRP